MSDLAAAAAALGIPEALAQRSAEAKAAASGSTVEEILAAWAGGAPAPAAAPPGQEDEPVDDSPSPDGQEAEEENAEPVPEVKIEIPSEETAVAAASAVTRAPVPAEVTMAEAANLPVVVTVPTTGIKERTNFAIPRWLSGLLVLVPIVALFALGGAATGECGNATELRTDVVTGDIVNCDGTPFEGSSVGGGSTDFVALGQAIYMGQEISSVNCAGCHGATGGGGVGPALNGVLTVFGACQSHIEWVGLGTAGFQGAGRSTYGDTSKQVGGGGNMPGFAASLSAEQLAAVAAFERVRFGGEAPEGALTDCGLAEPPPGEGAVPGEEPAPGTESDGETGTTLPDGDTTP